MTRFEISITQAVLEMLEKQIPYLEKTGQFAGVDYIRERLGYYEERTITLNNEKNRSLSLSEIAELHDIATHYCYALEAGDNREAHQRYYVSFVSQVRDKLLWLRDQGELAS